MGALQVFTIGSATIKIAVLARILSPSDFGVYGVALLILGFLEVLTETGINVFLIQEEREAEHYLDSAWVVSIFRGILIALVIFATSGLISRFFKTPGVTPLLYLVALVSLARGFINPMVVTFQKKLQFKNQFLFRAFLYSVDTVVAIIIGVITRSASAMILSMLVAALTEVLFSFVIFKSNPKFKFDKEKIRNVINRGKWITGAGTFSYMFQNVDNFIIGRFLGATPLGLYQQAYRISTLPVSQVGEVFNKVTFPVYVKIEGDRKRLKKAFVKTFLTILAMVIPFSIVILLFSHQLILFFLGVKWLPAEPVLKVLAIFGVFKSIVNSSYSLFLSLKKQEVVLLSELSGIIGISVFIFPLMHLYGLPGVGFAAIIGAFLSLPVVIFNIVKIFHK